MALEAILDVEQRPQRRPRKLKLKRSKPLRSQCNEKHRLVQRGTDYDQTHQSPDSC